MECRLPEAARKRVVRLWCSVFGLAALAGSGPDMSRDLDQHILASIAASPDRSQQVERWTPRNHQRPIPARRKSLSGDSQILDALGYKSAPRRRIPLFVHLFAGLSTPTLPIASLDDRRVLIGDEHGVPLVGRVFGERDSRVVILPDGSVGWPNALIYTDEPFTPFSVGEAQARLAGGAYRHFRSYTTDHYLIVSQGSPGFARQSGELLESLYLGLRNSFQALGFEAPESEFPLIAVIYRTESDFRENHAVAPEIQAVYDQVTNRIYFFEHRDCTVEDTRFAARRRPQTVAHEGAHQILANLGIQPRFADWPVWLIEGLAEYCSASLSPTGEWEGVGLVNSSHLSTLADLEDSLAIQGRSPRMTRSRIGPIARSSTVDHLTQAKELSETDYALSWGLVHYLANHHADDFVRYLRILGQHRPFVTYPQDEALEDFRSIFGEISARLDEPMRKHLGGLKQRESLAYFAVIFEQTIEPGVVRRGTMVSQSPLVIRQWLECMASAFSEPYEWRVQSFATRSAAIGATESWLKHN